MMTAAAVFLAAVLLHMSAIALLPSLLIILWINKGRKVERKKYYALMAGVVAAGLVILAVLQHVGPFSSFFYEKFMPFFSTAGSDIMANFVKEKLDAAKVKVHLFQDETRPTILKQRYRSSGKTLLRVNHLRQHPISKEIQNQIKSVLFDVINDQDVIIFSDFNYGCLPQALVDAIILECKKRNIMMIADSQSSSQIGDVSRFTDMRLMTPTEREARLALKDFESGLVVLAEKLRKKSRAENIFITLDKEGLLIHADDRNRNNDKDNYLTDRLEAMNKNPVDPAGAGDSLLTCSALALASGSDIWQSAYLGSVAAACQVGRNGNIPLSANDMNFGTRL